MLNSAALADIATTHARIEGVPRMVKSQGNGNGIAAAMPTDWTRMWTARFAGSVWQAAAGVRQPALP